MVSRAADKACRRTVSGVLRPKGLEANVTWLEADNKTLRNKIVQLKGIEERE